MFVDICCSIQLLLHLFLCTKRYKIISNKSKWTTSKGVKQGHYFVYTNPYKIHMSTKCTINKYNLLFIQITLVVTMLILASFLANMLTMFVCP